MLINVIVDNFTTLFELIGLLIILKISVHIPPRMKKNTVAVVVMLFAEVFCREWEFYTQRMDRLDYMRPILTAIIYTIYPFILIVFTQLTTEGLLSRRKGAFYAVLAPEIAAAVLYFTSQWTHIVCYFTPDNRYQGGPLSSLPYYLFALYYVVFIVCNCIYLKGSNRSVWIIMIYVTVGSGFGAALRIFTEEDSGFREFSQLFTAAVVIYYLFLYISRARLDTLTGLLNRQSFYMDLESERITAVVSVDMNDLKYYNDTFGHEAGDKALKTVSGVMRKYCGRGATAYRVGGDEFFILYEGMGRERVEASIAAMRENMAKTAYVCAFGCAMKFEAGGMEELLTLADSRMYEDKATLKKKGTR